MTTTAPALTPGTHATVTRTITDTWEKPMTYVERFFKSLDQSQPMTPDQVRDFERAHWQDKQERHGGSDRRLLAEMLLGAS